MIESSHIRSLTAAKITSGVINAHEIILKQQGNQTQIAAPANMAIIRSSDYDGSYTSNTWTPGTTGWVIAGNGYAEFSSASIRGGLVAGSIFINADNRWKTLANGATSNVPEFKVGTANNYLYYDGNSNVTVTGNVVTGNIIATGGKIAGWNISGNELFASDFKGSMRVSGDIGPNFGSGAKSGGIIISSPMPNTGISSSIISIDVTKVEIKKFITSSGSIEANVKLGEIDWQPGNYGLSTIIGSNSIYDQYFQLSPQLLKFKIGEEGFGRAEFSITPYGFTSYRTSPYTNLTWPTQNSGAPDSRINTFAYDGTLWFIQRLPNGNDQLLQVATVQGSRREIKDDIKNFEGGIELLNKLKPKTFRWKIGEKDPETGEKWAIDPKTGERWTEEAKEIMKLSKSYGFIVEEIQEELPEIVKYDNPVNYEDNPTQYSQDELIKKTFDITKWKPYDYSERDIVAILTKALQETVEKVNLLESKIKEIENNQNQ